MTSNEVLLKCRFIADVNIVDLLVDRFSFDARKVPTILRVLGDLAHDPNQASTVELWGENLPADLPEEIRVLLAHAQQLVDEANLTIRRAQDSKSPNRRKYELAEAQTRLIELKRMTVTNPKLEIVNLHEVLLLIAQIEQETVALQLKGKLDSASHGWWLEKKGKVREAIRAYESFVERASVKPFIYKRLAVLYRKLKFVDDEIRVLKEALKNVPESSKKHREWFRERLEKLKGVK